MSVDESPFAWAEDGDFLALRARRKERLEEGAQEDLQVELSSSEVGDMKRMSAKSKNAATRLFVGAAKASTEQFQVLLNRVKRLNVVDPATGKTILLHVLSVGRTDLARVIMAQPELDLDFLCKDCDVTVGALSGKKNVMHYVTELKNIELAEEMLNMIEAKSPGDASKVKDLLMQETPMEVEGQRSRTLSCCHLAAFLGCKELVVLYLGRGVPVDAVDSKKDTALFWAARGNHLAVVQELLSLGADAKQENDRGSTAFHWSVRYGHTDIVRLLITEGQADVTKTRELGLGSPTLLACALGYLPIVRLLIEAGADPDECVGDKPRPIHHAALEGHTDIVEYLLEKGAEIDAKDEADDTALLHAARHGHARCLQLLLTKGADHTVKNHRGEDLMSLAVDSDNVQILKMALQVWKTRGEVAGSVSPLLLAARAGHVEKIQLMFSMGLDPEVVDDKGESMLHYAARENRARVIEAVHHKVNVDLKNSSCLTALHVACQAGHSESVAALLACKASASIQSTDGSTALHYAASCRNIQPDTAERLMHHVTSLQDWETLKIQNKNGQTALHLAARDASPEVLKEFRYIPMKIKENHGFLALHYAAKRERSDALRVMLDIYETMKTDVDINEQQEDGLTVLHFAAGRGFKDCVERLVLLGADLSKQDRDGNTVFHLLVRLSDEHPEKTDTYLAVFKALVKKVKEWRSMKEHSPILQSDPQAVKDYEREAISQLLTGIFDKRQRNVIAVACELGASNIVKYVMPKLTRRSEDDVIVYDTTYLTPRTCLRTDDKAEGSGKTVVYPSYMQLLISSPNPKAACKILDLQPFSSIEKICYKRTAILSSIFFLGHWAYALFFSSWGLDCLGKRPNSTLDKFDEEWNAFDNYCFRWYYVSIAAIEPIIISVYWLLYTLNNETDSVRRIYNRLRHMKSATDVLYPVASGLFSMATSLAVIVWVALAVFHASFLNAAFSVAVSVVWLFSLPLLRWEVFLPSFWRIVFEIMLKDILRFLYLVVIVLFAFMPAFKAQFIISETVMDDYPNMFDICVLAFNLMLGMEDLFTDDFERSITAAGGNVYFMKCLYVGYMFFGAILLFNLLIAMMNNTYQSTLRKQKVYQRLEVLKLAIGWERDLQVFRRFGFRLCSTQFHRVPVGTDEDDEDTTELDPPQNELKEKVDSLEQKLLGTERKLDDIRSMLSEWRASKKN